jgi:hypothetical protein
MVYGPKKLKTISSCHLAITINEEMNLISMVKYFAFYGDWTNPLQKGHKTSTNPYYWKKKKNP